MSDFFFRKNKYCFNLNIYDMNKVHFKPLKNCLFQVGVNSYQPLYNLLIESKSIFLPVYKAFILATNSTESIFQNSFLEILFIFQYLLSQFTAANY